MKEYLKKVEWPNLLVLPLIICVILFHSFVYPGQYRNEVPEYIPAESAAEIEEAHDNMEVVKAEDTPVPEYDYYFHFDAIENVVLENCIGEELSIGEVLPYSNPVVIGEDTISYQRNGQTFEKEYPVQLWISKSDVWYEMTICENYRSDTIQFTIEVDLEANSIEDMVLPIEATLLRYNPNTTVVTFDTDQGLLEASPVLQLGDEYATFDQYHSDQPIWEEAINTEGILFENCFVVGAELPDGIRYYTGDQVYLKGYWQDMCFDSALVSDNNIWHIYNTGYIAEVPYSNDWEYLKNGSTYEGYAHEEWGSLWLTQAPRDEVRDQKAIELGTEVYAKLELSFERDLTGKPMLACLEAEKYWLRAGLDVSHVIEACGEMNFQYRWQVWDWTEDYDRWTDDDPSDNTLIGIAQVQLPVTISPWPPLIPDSFTHDLEEGWIQYETPSGSRFKASFETGDFIFIGPEQCWNHLEFIPNFKCDWSQVTQYQVP